MTNTNKIHGNTVKKIQSQTNEALLVMSDKSDKISKFIELLKDPHVSETELISFIEKSPSLINGDLYKETSAMMMSIVHNNVVAIKTIANSGKWDISQEFFSAEQILDFANRILKNVSVSDKDAVAKALISHINPLKHQSKNMMFNTTTFEGMEHQRRFEEKCEKENRPSLFSC